MRGERDAGHEGGKECSESPQKKKGRTTKRPGPLPKCSHLVKVVREQLLPQFADEIGDRALKLGVGARLT